MYLILKPTKKNTNQNKISEIISKFVQIGKIDAFGRLFLNY